MSAPATPDPYDPERLIALREWAITHAHEKESGYLIDLLNAIAVEKAGERCAAAIDAAIEKAHAEAAEQRAAEASKVIPITRARSAPQPRSAS